MLEFKKHTFNRLIHQRKTVENVACQKSHKSANYHAATERRRGATDIRMKPDRLGDSLVAPLEAVMEGTYMRYHVVNSSILLKIWVGRIDCITTAISGEKNEIRIRNPSRL